MPQDHLRRDTRDDPPGLGVGAQTLKEQVSKEQTRFNSLFIGSGGRRLPQLVFSLRVATMKIGLVSQVANRS